MKLGAAIALALGLGFSACTPAGLIGLPPPSAECQGRWLNNAATAFALDSTTIYWTSAPTCPLEGGGCYSMCIPALLSQPRVGGETTVLVEGLGTSAEGVAVDDASVFYLSGALGSAQALVRLPKSGGTPVVLSNEGAAPLVVLDASFVYWVGNGTILAALKDGDGSDASVVTNWDLRPMDMVADGTHLYWTRPSNPGPGRAGDVMRVRKTGGVAEVFVPAIVAGGSLAVAADRVYIAHTTSTGDAILVVSTDGTVLGDVVSGEDSMFRLAVQGTYLYWSAGGATQFRRLPLAGGPVETLMDGATTLFAVDDTFLYWWSDGMQRLAL